MTSPTDAVTVRLVEVLGATCGVAAAEIEGDEVARVASEELFSGQVTINRRTVDSLALTETLVRIEEELDLSLFEDDRADGARTLLDLVAIVVDVVDGDAIDRWLARPLHSDPWA